MHIIRCFSFNFANILAIGIGGFILTAWRLLFLPSIPLKIQIDSNFCRPYRIYGFNWRITIEYVAVDARVFTTQ